MSFALDYRKKMQADAGKAKAGKKTSRKQQAGFAADAGRKSDDTRGNRRRVLAALAFAGLILSVFNSGGLVRYAGGLGYNALVMQIIIASEDWHGLMERARATALVEGIRGAVTAARRSNWRDLAFGLDLEPTHPYLTEPETVHTDAPHAAPQDLERAAPAPDTSEEPATPVLRAAVEQ